MLESLLESDIASLFQVAGMIRLAQQMREHSHTPSDQQHRFTQAHLHTHRFTQAHLHTQIHTGTFTHTDSHRHIYTHTHIHTHTHTFRPMQMHVHSDTHTHTYTQTHCLQATRKLYARTHTHTHAQTTHTLFLEQACTQLFPAQDCPDLVRFFIPLVFSRACF